MTVCYTVRPPRAIPQVRVERSSVPAGSLPAPGRGGPAASVSASVPVSLSAGGELHADLPERLAQRPVRTAAEPAGGQGGREREPAAAAGAADGRPPGTAARPRAPGGTARAAGRRVRGAHPPAQLPEGPAPQPGAGAQGAGGQVRAGGGRAVPPRPSRPLGACGSTPSGALELSQREVNHSLARRFVVRAPGGRVAGGSPGKKGGRGQSRPRETACWRGVPAPLWVSSSLSLLSKPRITKKFTIVAHVQ